ncbi:linker for activation of T-cells family member 2 [Rhynchocyon petersi]
MSLELELLWTGAAVLLLLGVAAGLCVRCSRPGSKKAEKIYEQRSRQENQRSFAVARTYSFVRQMWPGPMEDGAPDSAQKRKDKLLQFSSSLEGSESPRYQNFHKGRRALRDPIPVDYYNWGRSQKPLEGDENSEDYQNSLSIQQWKESMKVMGPSLGGTPPSGAASPDEDSEPDYVNGDVAARDT